MAMPTLVLPLRSQAAACRSLWPPSHSCHSRNRQILALWSEGQNLDAIAAAVHCSRQTVTTILRRIRRTSGALPCKPQHALIEFCALAFDGPAHQQWGEALEQVRRWSRLGVPYTAQALLLGTDARALRQAIKRTQERCVNRVFPDESQLIDEVDYVLQRWQVQAGWPTDPTSPLANYYRTALRKAARAGTLTWSPHRTLDDHLRYCWPYGATPSNEEVDALIRAHRLWIRAVPIDMIAVEVGLTLRDLRQRIERVRATTQHYFFAPRSPGLDTPRPRTQHYRSAPAVDPLAELRTKVAAYRVMWRNGWREFEIARDLRASRTQVTEVIDAWRERKGWFHEADLVPKPSGKKRKRRPLTKSKAKWLDDPLVVAVAAHRPMWSHGWRAADIARAVGCSEDAATTAIAKLRQARDWFPVET